MTLQAFLVMQLLYINMKVWSTLNFFTCHFHYSFKYFTFCHDITGKVINTLAKQRTFFSRRGSSTVLLTASMQDIGLSMC